MRAHGQQPSVLPNDRQNCRAVVMADVIDLLRALQSMLYARDNAIVLRGRQALGLSGLTERHERPAA